MLILNGFPCDANTLRGQLKHSWLENEILYISVETAITLWRQGGAKRIQDLCHLAGSLAEGFSPAQLVDKLKPFGGLNMEERAAIKAAVHTAYLESSGILALQIPLKAAAEGMEAALQELSRAAELPQPQREGAVKTAWEGVREKAHTLVIELEQLPKGVVLP